MVSSRGIFLACGWPQRVHSAVIHAISLAHFSLKSAYACAAGKIWDRLQQESHRLHHELNLFKEELRLKDARMGRIPAQGRPNYLPLERLAILELRAARDWSLSQAATRLQVTSTTVASRMGPLDEGGPDALLQLRAPVNKFPDFVAYLLRRLKVLCPTVPHASCDFCPPKLERTLLLCKRSTLCRLSSNSMRNESRLSENNERYLSTGRKEIVMKRIALILILLSGTAVFNIIAKGRQEPADCPNESMFSQPALVNGGHVYVSDENTGYVPYEAFSGIWDEICSLQACGINQYNHGSAWLTRSENPMQFEIKFYEDLEGMPGAAVCSFSATAPGTNVGKYSGKHVFAHQVNLNSCRNIANGLGSMVGTGDSQCWLLWRSSQTGNDSNRVDNAQGMRCCSGEHYHDLSMSLLGFDKPDPPPELSSARAIPVSTPVDEDMGLIAFNSDRSGNDEIFIMDTKGGNLTQLTTNTVTDYWPTWSRDRSRIAFSSVQGDNVDIYVINSDGTNTRRLTHDKATDREPAWSPDGEKIAFESDRDGNPEVYIMNSDGTEKTRLTNHDAVDAYVHWSPDARTIVFCSNRDGNFEIYSMDIDGSNQIRLTNNDSPDWTPKWSPDGEKIAFVAERDGNREIYVMDPDGENQERITNHTGSDHEQDWSPDGSKMVFVSDRNGNEDVYLAHLSKDYNVLELRQLTAESGSNRHPVWR